MSGSELASHFPKRVVLGHQREFYQGGEGIIRDPAQEAMTRHRLYNEWKDTHEVRMPYYPVSPGRKRKK